MKPFFIFLFCITSLWSNAQINKQNITICRDSFGTPHIFGNTDAEAAYGLAWAHCEDDFKSIQEQLLAARGKLGAVEGKSGVIFDYALHLFSIDTFVDAHYEADISPSFKKILEAYAQAVNDFATSHPSEVLLKSGFPTTPKDIIKGYTLTLSLMAGTGLAIKAIKDNAIEQYMSPNEPTGSNAMVIAPSKTEDGKTWFLSNSHQPLEGRFAWYEAHVSSKEGWDCMGGLFAGGVGIFVGTNQHLSWTHTVNYNNWGDIYLLKTKGKKYFFENEWHTMTSRKAKLKVKLGGITLGVTKMVYSTVYGPVFKAHGKSYALRFPAYHNIKAAEEWFNINKAQTMNEYMDALKMEGMTQFNVIYADQKGNIFYQNNGALPKRNPALNWHLPITSTSSAYLWNSLIPFEDRVTVINPSCGFVYNCNQTPLHATGNACNWNKPIYPGLQLFEYNRGELFGSMLNGIQGKMKWSEFLDIKYNKSYKAVGSYASHFDSLYQLSETKYPALAEAIQMLKQWNKSGDADSKAATIAMLVHKHLAKTLSMQFGLLMIRREKITEQQAVEALQWTVDYMKEKYGSIQVPLGDVQRLIRGNVSLPASGLSEVPRASDVVLYDKKKGIYRVDKGDGFMQFTKWGIDGPEIYSINPYGSSARPNSIHYTDQMELFNKERLRTMTLNKNAILNEAVYTYHPGEIDYVKLTSK
jgi:acyl-homoserine-lactone acylase